MAEIQIALAQFQAPAGEYLRNTPHSEYECFMVDDERNHSMVDGYGVNSDPNYRTPFDFYTAMIAQRAQGLDTITDPQYTTSAHKILNTIRGNVSSYGNDEPCFYLSSISFHNLEITLTNNDDK